MDGRASSDGPFHPLDPLSANELNDAAAILRRSDDLTDDVRLISLELREPPKDLVLGWTEGEPIRRDALAVLHDRRRGSACEVLVSLRESAVTSRRQIHGLQPAIHPDEAIDAEAAIKSDPAFVAALAKRDVDQPDLVMVDVWSVGNFGVPEESNRRLAKGLSWLRTDLRGDNGYARPIEGLVAVVDLDSMEVVRVEDHGVVPIPQQHGNYDLGSVGDVRADLKPLSIEQEDGPSFEIAGREVRWQKWRIRVGFTPREGLVLHTIGYEDAGRIRPIVHRASFSEMVIPYGDPSPTVFFKNAFDIGEHGLGPLTNSLELGCDCLGAIRYFDASLCDSRGEVQTIANAICMHEEDFGLLWKHYDWRSGATQTRRSRRLVISSIATVGNYEYGFYWYFYQDARIQTEVKLTGILHTRAVGPGETPAHGALVAPNLNAPVHQHFFNVRLDMAVDGASNSVYEVQTEADPAGPDNPYGNAFRPQATLLETERHARRDVAPLAARFWRIVNPTALNALGEPVSYALVPGENVRPFSQRGSSIMRRAGFLEHQLWVTPFDPAERFPAGEYPNQHSGGDGLPAWTQRDRSIENTDLVVWYTFGAHHVPRPEDWPVMPVQYIGFSLQPRGFFDRNPALDVPAPEAHDACAHEGTMEGGH